MGKQKQSTNQIKILARLFLEAKSFKVDKAKIPFSVHGLVESKILTEQNNEVSLNQGEYISEAGLEFFKKKFEFKKSADPEKLKQFTGQIEGYFDTGDLIMGLTNFLDHLYNHLLTEFRNEGGELITLVKTLDQTTVAFYNICKVIENKLPELSLSVGEVIELFEWLTEAMKVEDETILNIDLISLGKGLRLLCQQDQAKGIELVNQCVKSDPQRLHDFHCNILSGVLEADTDFLTKIEHLLKSTTTMHSALCALTAITYQDTTPIPRFIFLAEQQTTPTEHYLQTLPRFYSNIIRSHAVSDIEVKVHCFDRLNQLILSGNPNVLVQVMREIRFITGFDEQIGQLMETLIHSENFQSEYSKAVLEICNRHSEYATFFQLLKSLIKKLKSSLPFDEIRDICRSMSYRKPEEFEKELIVLLTDDYGLYRMWAVRILNTLRYRNNQGFSFPVESLDDLLKVKLAISITSDLAAPEKIVPYLIPILRSDNELVVALVIHRLEILTKNYGSGVIESLQSYLDLANVAEVQIISGLQTYLDGLEAVSEQKWKIKELDPRYSSYKYLNQFRNSKEKHMRGILDSAPKTGILSFGTTVQLMKGGGFKIGEKNQVSPLSTITTSVSLPQEYVLSPEQFDWERKIMYNENWKGKFDQWAAIL